MKRLWCGLSHSHGWFYMQSGWPRGPFRMLSVSWCPKCREIR